MSKDTFYFSHDYNARNDIKIKRLIAKHNYLGYGLFWAIIEDLYNNANALPLDYECIAFDLRADVETVRSIINDFGLFTQDDGFFGSLSIQKRLDERNLKSKKARESALNRWSKSERNANALPTQSDRNAIKERKVKESKGNILLEKETKDHFSKNVQDGKNEAPQASKKVAQKKVSIDELEMPAEFVEIWEEWTQYRKARKFKAYAAEKYEQLAVNKLLELSNKDPVIARQILEQTFANNYQGFFPLKNINNGPNQRFSSTAAAASGNYKTAGKTSARTILAKRNNGGNAANGAGGNITIDVEAQ